VDHDFASTPMQTSGMQLLAVWTLQTLNMLQIAISWYQHQPCASAEMVKVLMGANEISQTLWSRSISTFRLSSGFFLPSWASKLLMTTSDL
jgi:hypothetical protein